jgi:hypothetical protein
LTSFFQKSEIIIQHRLIILPYSLLFKLGAIHDLGQGGRRLLTNSNDRDSIAYGERVGGLSDFSPSWVREKILTRYKKMEEEKWVSTEPQVWKEEKEGDAIEGKLMEKRKNGGKYGNASYLIESDDGETENGGRTGSHCQNHQGKVRRSK